MCSTGYSGETKWHPKYKYLNETASASTAKCQPLYSNIVVFPPFRKHHVEATTTVTHCGRVAFYIATYRLSSTHVMITRYEYQAITSAMFILMSLGPPEKISVKMLTITATIINKYAFPESNGVHNFQ